MDLATAERLMSAPDPKSLSALKNQGNNPVAAKAVAGQFAALLLQNVMQNSDGTALPIAGDGIGGNIVSGLFASAVSQAAASGDKFGLADILFHAIEAKQRSAAPSSSKTEMPAPAPRGAQASFRAAQSPGAAHGLTGVSAATEAMQTVANNTANVSTPGYNTPSVNQVELPGVDDGPGASTEVTSIQRAFDQFLYQQGVQASSANQAAQVVQTNAQNLAALFPTASGGAGGLGSAIDSFFAAANQVAQDPTVAANRQAFLGQAQSLAAAFQSVGGQISASLSSVDGQTAAAVQQINDLTQQIAQLNQTIAAHWLTEQATNYRDFAKAHGRLVYDVAADFNIWVRKALVRAACHNGRANPDSRRFRYRDGGQEPAIHRQHRGRIPPNSAKAKGIARH